MRVLQTLAHAYAKHLSRWRSQRSNVAPNKGLSRLCDFNLGYEGLDKRREDPVKSCRIIHLGNIDRVNSGNYELASEMSISGLSRLEKSIEDFKLTLNPEDHNTLKNYSNPNAEDVANFVKDLDAKLQQKQKRRKALQSSPFTIFIQSLQQFSGIVDTCVQSNPEIAALVWGGVKFVLLVRKRNLGLPQYTKS
ncbi:hypothetical protein TWF718_006299 [Orbilia javanica]|uniref:Uncharacterized protein n=1 Tax=Orbilia javanica TaxID=47235 RepID=A0AAN8MWD4_9PEZI